jgi:hypothetical protein
VRWISRKTGAGIWLTKSPIGIQDTPLGLGAALLAAIAGPPGAVEDDAEEDDDHAHHPREVGGQLGRRVDVVAGDLGGDRVEHDVRGARQDQRNDADLDDERDCLGISPQAFYD